MTDDAKLVLQCLFQTVWRLFTSWHIPGTNVTPAGMFLFIICAGIGLNFMYRVLDVAPSSVDVSGAIRSTAKFEKSLSSKAKKK